MKFKDIAAYRAHASSLEMYELVNFIKQIEKEKKELEPHMDTTKYDVLINIYLDELFLLSAQRNPKNPISVH